MWTREQLKDNAKNVLQCCRWPAVAVCLIMSAVSSGGGSVGRGSSGNSGSSNSNTYSKLFNGFTIEMLIAVISIALIAFLIGIAVSVFVKNPLRVGEKKFYINARANMQGNVGDIIFGFKNNYIKNVGTIFLKDLFVFLWSLLLWVPGIIKSYEYRMVEYLLADFPELTRQEAFDYSKRMTDGQKWDMFILDLSFIPWYLLSVLTCGILIIFHVGPYVGFTNVELYEELKRELVSKDIQFAALVNKDVVTDQMDQFY